MQKLDAPEIPRIDNSGIERPSNFSGNRSLNDILNEGALPRRALLKGGLSMAITAFMAGCSRADRANPASASQPTAAEPREPSSRLGFQFIGTSRGDTVQVPEGYSVTPLVPWGTPIHAQGPAFHPDGSNSGTEQEQQVGSHHDGMHFFPIDLKTGGQNSTEGLLVMNHEYIDPDVLHPNGPTLGKVRPADEVHKEMAAHGVSVLHIRQDDRGDWHLVAESSYNRRITALTPMEIRGPVRGTAKLSTRFSPAGEATRGTFNNCAHGVTPWGTYLAAEENWAGYFSNQDPTQPREHRRYGVGGQFSRYRWDAAESDDSIYQRFNASQKGAHGSDDFRNEPNHFGWMVEIDPFAPDSVPQKRSALGRFAHEGVIFAPVTEGKPLVCYSGDDSKNEYIYKFVSAAPYQQKDAGGHLLDQGTLYVACFHADGSGEWLPLDINDAGFKAKAEVAGVEFADQADVLINTRLAADVSGATKMDRPEWGAIDPKTGGIYFSLSNNSDRASNAVDAANPRADNVHGHIIRWLERGSDHSATKFLWDIFLLAGPAGTKTPGDLTVTLTEANQLSCPDGLWFDSRGVLWIQTDMPGAYGTFGNNQMLAADPGNKEVRRFLVGPVECEVTGVVMTPDLRTMFVNIQHPGDRSIPGRFTSHWPDGGTSRPRSATVIIRKNDGGIIGT